MGNCLGSNGIHVISETLGTENTIKLHTVIILIVATSLLSIKYKNIQDIVHQISRMCFLFFGIHFFVFRILKIQMNK